MIYNIKYNVVTLKTVMESGSEAKPIKSLTILIPSLLFPAEFTSLYFSPAGELSLDTGCD